MSKIDPGIIAYTYEIDPELVLNSYVNGAFPWPFDSSGLIPWCSPNPRGILKFSNFHVSKSLSKFLKKHPYQVKFNENFLKVIKSCATIKRPKSQGSWITPEIIEVYQVVTHFKPPIASWITPEIIEVYQELFLQGYCYSVEVYEKRKLVAGLYGVRIGNYVTGESMFTTVDNGSKLALVFLVDKLRSEGLEWLDCQQVTPTLKSFGAEHVTRKKFYSMLSKCL